MMQARSSGLGGTGVTSSPVLPPTKSLKAWTAMPASRQTCALATVEEADSG